MKPCTVCCHEQRNAIDQQLLSGTPPLRHIARATGLSKTALIRHRDTHISVSLAKAHQAAEDGVAEKLFAEVQRIMSECKRLQLDAEGKGDTRAALQALQTMSRQVELLARMAIEVNRQRTEAQTTRRVDVSALATTYTLDELMERANHLRREEGLPELVIDLPAAQ